MNNRNFFHLNAKKNRIFKPSAPSFQIIHLRHLILLLFVSTLIPNFSCRKDKTSGDIPYVSVNLLLPLSLPEYAPLNSVGNSIEIAGGYKGIIVYHRFQNEFVAFEKACPYDPLESAAIVEKDSSNVIGVDRNCGSKFYLTDGSVLNGPATRSLKQYQTDYDAGAQTLSIYN